MNVVVISSGYCRLKYVGGRCVPTGSLGRQFPWAQHLRLASWSGSAGIRSGFLSLLPCNHNPCGPRENVPYSASVLVAAPLCPFPSWLRNKVSIGSYKVTEIHFLYLLISGDFCSLLLLEFFGWGLNLLDGLFKTEGYFYFVIPII